MKVKKLKWHLEPHYVDEKWMKLTRSARHYMERRAKARKETIDGSEARH